MTGSGQRIGRDVALADEGGQDAVAGRTVGKYKAVVKDRGTGRARLPVEPSPTQMIGKAGARAAHKADTLAIS